MLVSILLIIYNLSVAFAAGVIFTRVFSKLLGVASIGLHPTLFVLTGWAFISILLQVYHLFFAINLFAHVLVWLILFALASTQLKNIAKDIVTSLHQIATKKHLLVGVSFLILVVLNIVSRRADGDIGDYHLQAIKWIEEYPAVPGLGNIRRQLGNNSNWFLLNAFSGLSFLGLKSVYTINAGLVIMAALYVTPHLNQHFWLRNFLLLLYFTIIATRKYTGAVTNDLIVTTGIIILFSWFTDVVHNQNKKQIEIALLIVLTMALITYKLSALPMAIFALGVYVYAYQKNLINKRITLGLAAIGLIIFTPWIITNIIHSGYLLFPVTSSNLLGVDWQMHPEIVAYEVYANLAYARAPLVDIEIARHFTFKEWWPHWIKSLDIFSIILLLGGIVFYIIMFAELIVNKRFKNQFKETYLWVIALTCLVALILWFTHGPTPRFVFGYLVFTITMGVNLFHRTVLQQLLYKQKFTIIIIALLAFIALSFTQHLNSNLTSSLIIPPNYTQPALTNFNVDGGILFVPQINQQCWDSNLPCTNLPDSTIQFRGKSLQQGFRVIRK